MGVTTGCGRGINRALLTTAFNRSYSDPATIAYIAKRTKEGKTPTAILRCLKRYIARLLFRKLNAHAA